MKVDLDKTLQISSEFDEELINEIGNKTKILIDSEHCLFEMFEIYLQELDNEMEFYYNKEMKSHITYYWNKNKLYVIYIPVDVSSNGNYLGINGAIHIYLKDDKFDYTKDLINSWNCEIQLTNEQRNELEEYLKSKNIKYYFK